MASEEFSAKFEKVRVAEMETEAEEKEELALKEQKQKEFKVLMELLEKEKELDNITQMALDAAYDAYDIAKETRKEARKVFNLTQAAALAVRSRVDALQLRLNDLWGSM